MTRSPLSALSVKALEDVQRGTLQYEWKGVLCCKNPFDLALYAKLLWQLKPATLIEIGTYYGGSALWFADMAQALGVQTRILSIDIEPFKAFADKRIEFRQGNSKDLGAVLSRREMLDIPRPLLVIDDASHRYDATLATLRFFDQWMRPGEYFAVEDGIVDSMGASDRYDGGPNRAVSEFLGDTDGRYEIDANYCDYFGYNVTWNTNGFLRRTQVEGQR